MYEKVNNNDSMKIFTELLSVPSPTGREELIAAKILEIAARWGDRGQARTVPRDNISAPPAVPLTRR